MQEIDPDAWIAPSAQLYGKVSVGAGSSVWPNAVIRSECQEVTVGRMTNLQDFVMVHVGYDHATHIGDFCSVTHHATVHGATLEDDCLVGIGAVVMDGAVIGRGSIVAPGAIVREGMIVPPCSIVAGVPAKVIRERDNTVANRMNALNYQRNAAAYRGGEHRAWAGDEFRAWAWGKLRELNSSVS